VSARGAVKGRLLAVTGKGGAGKTTVAAFLVRLLLERGVRPVLAVDADPNSTLAPMLGVRAAGSISASREEMMAGKGEVSDVPKQRALALKLEGCLVEAEGFDLLVMGRSEGQSCYCFVNNLLREALRALRARYAAAVVDNEAGMEHLSRMNTDDIDCLVVVSEPTRVSARSAARIVELVESLPVRVKRRVLVWNKVGAGGVPEAAAEPLAAVRFDAAVRLPEDAAVARLSEEEASAVSAEMPGVFDGLLGACMMDSEPSRSR
jgi:CO dehydrogenase maturation factor